MTVAARVVDYAMSIARAGSAAALAFSLGTAVDAANRIGLYGDTTGAAEQLSTVVGGVQGPAFLRTGSNVVATGLKARDNTFQIVDESDVTKSIAFQAASLTSGFQLTIESGAQAANRTLSVPVLGGNRTLALIDQAQTFTAAQTFSSTVRVNGASIGALGVLTASDTTAGAGNPWDSTKHTLVAGPATSTTSAAIGFAYDQSTNRGYMLVISPGLAWRDMTYKAYSHNFSVSSADPALAIGVSGELTHTPAAFTTGIVGMTSSITWNSGGTTFTGWKLNVTDTASAAASLLLDLQISGSSKSSIAKDGRLALSHPETTATSQAFLRVVNSSAVGQVPVWEAVINGSTRGRVRVDYVGNVQNFINGGDWYLLAGTDGASTGLLQVTASGRILQTAGTLTSTGAIIDSAATWNSGGTTFTGWKLNVINSASAAASLLLDLQVGAVSRCSVRVDGMTTHAVVTATTSAADVALTIANNSSGTPAAGYGSSVVWNLKSSTTADQNALRLDTTWVVATHASRTARAVWSVYDTAAREGLRIEASGTAPMIGFLGASAVARPAAYTQTFATATRTMNAYTSDPESSAYTGQDNAQAGTVYAKVADLNQLRTAYETLRAMAENVQQVVNQVIDDHQAYGLLA